jgi:hypothetical protein
MQFSSMNSLAFADIDERNSSMANTIASTTQQLSMSFGLACGSLLTGWYLGGLPQTDQIAVTQALHAAFITLGIATGGSSFVVVLRMVGETDEVQVQTRWKDRDGSPTLVEASHLSRTERPQHAGAEPEEDVEPA